MKTYWRILSNELVERPEDYTATFVMLNVDSGAQVTVTLSQKRGCPATDLVGALRATASLLISASGASNTTAEIEKLN